MSVKKLFLVSPAFSDTGFEKLDDFNFTIHPKNIEKQAEKIYLVHSRDDFVVPFEHSEGIKNFLPNAELVVFEDRGHFLQEEFPEIIEKIKELE